VTKLSLGGRPSSETISSHASAGGCDCRASAATLERPWLVAVVATSGVSPFRRVRPPPVLLGVGLTGLVLWHGVPFSVDPAG